MEDPKKKFADALINEETSKAPESVYDKLVGNNRGEISEVETSLFPKSSIHENLNLEDYKNSFKPGRVFINESLNLARAQHQSGTKQAFNAVAGTLLSVVPKIVGGTAAMADLEDYNNVDNEVGNAISREMEKWSGTINQDWFPIYRENPEKAFDFSDPGYWYENGRMIATSAMEFIAEGYLAGGFASAMFKGLVKAKKLTGLKTAQALGSKMNNATVSRLANTITSGESQFIKGMSGLTTAVMLNQSESIGSAIGVYDTVYSQLIEEGIAEPEALQKAADAAAYTVSLNKANILLNLTSASMFVKSPWSTRALTNPVNLKNTIKKLGYEGAQEWAEETVNYVSEKAGTARGQGKDLTWQEMIKEATSEHGLEAGFLGMIGGIAQTAGTIGTQHLAIDKLGLGVIDHNTGKRISQIEAQKQQYSRQQEEIGILETLLHDRSLLPSATNVFINAKELFEYNKELGKAIKEKDSAKIKELNNKSIAGQAKNHFENGTTEKLIEFYKAIKESDPSEGMDVDENSEFYYKKRAQEAIDSIKSLEKEYVFAREFINKDQVYSNRAAKVFKEQEVSELTKAKENLTSQVEERIESLLRRKKASLDFYKKRDTGSRDTEGKFIPTKEKLDYSVHSLMDPVDVRTLGKEASSIYNKFLEDISKDPIVSKYMGLDQEIKNTKEDIDIIEDMYDTITAPSTQQILKNHVEELDKQYKEEQKERTREKVKENDIKDKSDTLEEMDNVKDLKNRTEDTLPDSVFDSTDPEGPIGPPPSLGADDPSLSSTGRANVLKTKGTITEQNNPGKDTGLTVEETVQAFQEGETIVEQLTPSPVQVYTDSHSVENAVMVNNAEEVLQKEPDKIVGVTEDNSVVYEYGRLKTAHNKLAYKSRDYSKAVTVDEKGRTRVRKEDISNLLSNALMSKVLLDPDKLQPGDKITLRPKLDDTQEVSYNGEIVPYGSLPDNVKAIKAPIVVEYNGEEVSFIHDVDWINNDNISGSVLEEQALLQSIREHILANGEVSTTISHTGNGTLLRTYDNSLMPVSTAMPDSSLELAVTVAGEFNKSWIPQKNIDLHKKVEILNDERPNGLLWALAKVNKTKEGKDATIAIPLRVNKLKTAYVQSILNAVKVFVYQSDKGNHGEQARKMQAEFEEKTGLNLFDVNDLRKYLNTFVYADFKADKGVKLIDYLKLPDTPSDVRMINVSPVGIEWGRGKIKGDSLKNITASTINSEVGRSKIRTLFDELGKHLSEMYLHVNLSLFDEQSFKAPIITEEGIVDSHSGSYKDFIKHNTTSNVFSVNIGTEESPKYVYTLQRTIEFDTSFIPQQENSFFAKKGPVAQVTETALPTTVVERENRPSTLVEETINKIPQESLAVLSDTNSEIEAKKADIEKRREEVRNIFTTNPILALHIIEKEKRIGSYDDYGRPNGNVQDIVAILKVSVSKAQELQQDYLKAGKPKEWKFGDAYDYSKYDAELKALEETNTTTQLSTSVKLFNNNDKELKKGSVVEYKGKKYLFWNNNKGKAQLINTDGSKFSGTPSINILKVLGSYITTTYNNVEYIVTDNNNVYSGATGNLVYTGNDNSSKVQKQKIIDSVTQLSSTQSKGAIVEVKISPLQLSSILSGYPGQHKINSILGLDIFDERAIVFLEKAGIISKKQGTKPRVFLKNLEESLETLAALEQTSTQEAADPTFDKELAAKVQAKKELSLKVEDIKTPVQESEAQEKAQENKPNTAVEIKTKRGRVIKVTKKDTGNEEFDLPADRSVLDAIQKDINSFLLIPGLTTARQQTLIDNVAYDINAEVIEKGTLTTKEIFDEWSQTFTDLKEAHESLGNITQVNDIDSVLNNWDMFKNLTLDFLSQFSTLKITEDLGDEMDQEENGGDLSKTNYSDEASLMISGKDTISPKLKRFFSSVVEIGEDGAPVENYVSLDKFVPFDIVYNTLSAKLGGDGASFARADYDQMIAILEDNIVSAPFLRDVIDKLNKADQQTKNEFVMAMAKHYVRMKRVLWSGNLTDGYLIQVMDSNTNSIAKVIENKWQNNSRVSNLFNVVEDDLVINEVVADSLISLYKSWKDTTTFSIDEIGDWLSVVGVDLSGPALEHLGRHGLYVNGVNQRGLYLLDAKKGVIGVLAGKIEFHLQNLRKGEPITTTDINILEDSSITNLAKLEAKYIKNVFSNSMRDGEGKTIYSYTQNKYAMIRLRDLLQDPENNKLINDLLKIPFTKSSSWLNELSTNSLMREVHEISYMDTLNRRDRKGSKGKKLKDMSKAEHELTKLSFLFGTGSKRKYAGQDGARIGRFMYPTMSDKTTMLVAQAVLHNTKLLSTGEIHPETIDAVYSALVIPEIERIKANQLDPIKHIKGYDKGANMFYFLPELNNLEEFWKVIEHEDGTRERFLKDVLTDPVAIAVTKQTVKDYLNDAVSQKIKEWEGMGLKEGSLKFLDSRYIKNIITGNNKVKFAALDYVANYMIANANMFQVYIGDPAQFYKKDGATASEDFVGISQDTFINIGKRLAGDIAPGYEIANTENDKYVQGFISDRESESLAYEYYKQLLDDYSSDSKPYSEIEGTDAQEFTSWQEHLKIMFNSGKLKDSEYAKIKKLLESEQELSKDLLSVVMQPMKPVYVNNIVEYGKNGNPIMERRIYIKSSSFPLLPQLTKGLEIDKLREVMKKEGVDRVAFGTAVKVGNFTNTPQFFQETESGYVGNKDFSFGDRVKTLPRTGFRLQQEVPYDADKDSINDGTQQRKLLFSDILNVEGFEYKGETLSGKQLKEKYDALYENIYKKDLEKLSTKLGVKDGKPNWKKVQSILQAEAKKRNYPINDILALKLDKNGNFEIPIWASSSSAKFESLLLSLVDGDVRKKKTRGASFVLGTEEGFKRKNILEGDEGQAVVESTNGIIFSSSWKGKLLPQRTVIKSIYESTGEEVFTTGSEDSLVLPAQVIAPNKLKDQSGNKIDLTQFIKNGVLDTSKVPSDVLKMFGFRIPTQGLNSMSYIEIVGFLPDAMGDLLIAPRDWTKQMGSDFDVDKLYAYMYNTYIKDGELKIYRREDFTQEEIDSLGNVFDQNELLDIHFSVLSNPSKEVQKKIAKPLDFGDLKKEKDGKETGLAKQVADIRAKRVAKFSPLSPDYQRDKFMNATAGKAGVGNFSNDSTFNALVQDKDLELVDPVYIKGDLIYVPVNVVFGNDKSQGDLSGAQTLKSKRTGIKKSKSDVIAAYQSAAVDNEKEQILDKLNINSHTFNVIKVLNQLGFEEDVVIGFIAQDIIFDYVDELVRLKDSTNDVRVTNPEEKAVKNLIEKYEAMKPQGSVPYKDSMSNLADIGADQLMDKIRQGGQADPNTQIAILKKFVKLSEYGVKIKAVQSAINTDSAGLGKNLLYSVTKEEQVVKLWSNKNILNAHKLIGEYSTTEEDGYYPLKSESGKYVYVKPTTISGFATVFALGTNNRLWESVFPYQTKAVKSQFLELEKLFTSELSLQEASELRMKLWEDMKSFIYTSPSLGIFSTNNLQKRRKELFFDEYVQVKEDYESSTGEITTFFKDVLVSPSLATNVETALSKKELAVNPFLNKLTVEKHKNNAPSLVKFEASSGENFDEKNTYIGFTELLTKERTIRPGYTTVNLASDLIEYAFLEGGIQKAIQFVKFVPNAFLVNMPFANALKHMDFRDNGIFGTGQTDVDYFNTSRFTDQHVQHNSYKVLGIDNKDLGTLFKGASLTNAQFKNTTRLIPIESDSWKSYMTKDVKQNGHKLSEAYPVYFTINHKLGTMLFKFDGTGYNRLDTLGAFGMSEYDFSVSEARTNITNKAYISPNNVSADRAASLANSVEVINIDSNKEKIKLISSLNASIQEGVAEIATESHSDHFKAVADFVLSNLPDNVEFLTERGGLKRGNTLKIDNSWRITVWPDAHKSRQELERTVLHEAMHVVTVDALKNNPEISKQLNKIIQGAISTLPVQRQKEIRNLIAAENKSALNDQGMYGLFNVSELVAEAFTNPEFQDFLKTIPYEFNKTVWQKIVEVLSNAFEAMFGTKLKPNALSAVFDLTIQAIEADTGKTAVFQKTQRLPGNFNPEIGLSESIDLPLFREDIDKESYNEFLKKKKIC